MHGAMQAPCSCHARSATAPAPLSLVGLVAPSVTLSESLATTLPPLPPLHTALSLRLPLSQRPAGGPAAAEVALPAERAGASAGKAQGLCQWLAGFPFADRALNAARTRSPPRRSFMTEDVPLLVPLCRRCLRPSSSGMAVSADGGGSGSGSGAGAYPPPESSMVRLDALLVSLDRLDAQLAEGRQELAGLLGSGASGSSSEASSQCMWRQGLTWRPLLCYPAVVWQCGPLHRGRAQGSVCSRHVRLPASCC